MTIQDDYDSSSEEGSSDDYGSYEEESSESVSDEKQKEGSESGSYEEEGSESGSYEEEDGSGSYDVERDASGSYEEGSGSYEEGEGSQSGSYDEEEGSHSGSYEEEGSQAGSYEEEDSQAGSAGEEGSHSGSYDEEGSHSGSQEEEGSGSIDQGSHSGSYEEEGEGSGSYEEEGEASGSYEEEGEFSGSYEEEGDASGSYAEEGSHSGSYEEEGEGSGSYEDGEGSGSYEDEKEASESYEDEDGEHSGSYEEEGEASGSYEDDGSRSGSFPEEGSHPGSYGEEEDASASYEEGEEDSGSYEEEGEASGSFEDEEEDNSSGGEEEGDGSISYADEGEASVSLEGGENVDSGSYESGSYDDENKEASGSFEESDVSEDYDDGEGSSQSDNIVQGDDPSAEASHSGSLDEEEFSHSDEPQEEDDSVSRSDCGDSPQDDKESSSVPQKAAHTERSESRSDSRGSDRDEVEPEDNLGSLSGDDRSGHESPSGSRDESATESSSSNGQRDGRVSASQFMPGQDDLNFSFNDRDMSTSRGTDPSFAIDEAPPAGVSFDAFGIEQNTKEKATNEGLAVNKDFASFGNTSGEPDFFRDSSNVFSERPATTAGKKSEYPDKQQGSFQSKSENGGESTDGSGFFNAPSLQNTEVSAEQVSFDGFGDFPAFGDYNPAKTTDENIQQRASGGNTRSDNDHSSDDEGQETYIKQQDETTERGGNPGAEDESQFGGSIMSGSHMSESTGHRDAYGAKKMYQDENNDKSIGAMMSADHSDSKPEHGDDSSKGSARSSSSRSSRIEIAAKRAAAKEIEGVDESISSPTKTRTLTGYTREQMTKLIQVPRESIVSDDNEDELVPSRHKKGKRKKKKKKRKGRVRVKSEALLELAANVNGCMIELENDKETGDAANSGEDEDSSPRRVLHSFEVLVGMLLRLSDELELLATFGRPEDAVAIEALRMLLSYTDFLDDIFSQVKPILLHFLKAEVDEEMEDFLYGMNLILEQLNEMCHRVGDKQQWGARANTSYLTLLELLARDTLEITCIYDDVDTPAFDVSEEIQLAWEATGHDEEVQTLLVAADLAVFRQICYEVMLSCDQWCPDTEALLDICAIEESMDQVPPPQPDEDMVPPPEAALQVLEKVHGEYLTRIPIISSILRRILPPEEVTDARMKDSFAKIRSTIRNPLGLSPSTLVSITSIPEDPDDEEALGVAGVGKTTMAAMVANHPDVRRFFFDGIAWIYIGPTELNYTRYVQCLQDLVGQLELEEEEEPSFPELLHTPGESEAKRRRREEGFMIYVRQIMVEFLEGLNVLIILDDVCFDPDLDWFDFAPPATTEPEEEEGSSVVLVTSRRRTLLPDADTVEVDMLEESEAINLLIRESGDLSKTLIPDSPEIKRVVVECAHHALAVKSIGKWLNLKHATTGVTTSSVEEIHLDVAKSMDTILKNCSQEEADMMYEILNMSMSPEINGEPTSILKFCFAAFVKVFCEREYISDFALADSTPIVPRVITEMMFKSILDLEEKSLMTEGSMFFEQKKKAATLIPEVLSALGLFKVIITFVEDGEQEVDDDQEEKFVQIMHKIQQEYGEYLYEEDPALTDLAKEGERRWNKAFAKSFLAQAVDWDSETPDAGLDYALEMMPAHMYRGGMLKEAANLLSNTSFVRGRLFALGRENGTRRQIKDSEALFDLIVEQRSKGKKKLDAKAMLRNSYEALGGLLYMDEDELIAEEGSPEAVEVGRSHYEIGLSLAERRDWDTAISHWEKSQELLVSALGLVELVAGLLYNVGAVYAEKSEYEQALDSLKQCLKIRGAIHGEEHILYAQTIQKIGDVFLSMSDYHEAMESYNWALDVMHIEPTHHRIDIGDILENTGNIHYSKGNIEESLQCFQDALRSKQVDLGEDHPELATTFHHIGNCLSDQGKTEEAIAHLEEAIRLKNLDPDGGRERDADVLTIQGVLHNLNGRQQEGLESYEKALQVLVTKVPHKKEKVASLLHLIGCVYLMSGEHKKAMKLFEESLQARRKILGFVHLDVASTLFNMAFLHQSRNRLDKALKCLEEALKIRQLRLPDSEKVAVTHEKIGNLARAMGKTKKAEIAFEEALRIRKLVHGENHEAVATVLQELGDLMDDLGETDSAMKHYVQALEIRESRLGPDDIAVAETYYSMGYTLQSNEASDRALQCFEEALSIRKFQLGEDAKEVGDTLNMMGFLQAQRGELDDAISLLWEALRIRKLNNDSVKISETLKNIGNVHREKQEFELSIECYEECLRIRREELGDESEKLADALIAMGNVLSDMDSTEEAMETYKEGTSIWWSCGDLRSCGRPEIHAHTVSLFSLNDSHPTVRRTRRERGIGFAVYGNT